MILRFVDAGGAFLHFSQPAMVEGTLYTHVNIAGSGIGPKQDWSTAGTIVSTWVNMTGYSTFRLTFTFT